MTITISAILLLGGAFVLSTVLTAVVRSLSIKTGFVARPTGDRHNQRIVPLGGGIAIFLTIATLCLGAAAIVKWMIIPGSDNFLGQWAMVHRPGFLDRLNELFVLLGCAGGLFLLGLWDDRKKLGPFLKLFIQVVIATLAAVFAGVRVEFFIQNQIITTSLSVFWIVLIINAINFLDNMDGLAAGIGIIVSSILLTAAITSGQIFIGGMAVIFIGALLGFLVFNFPPAKIFMGDAGSLVVGFFLAMLSLRTTYYLEAMSGRWYPVLMPLVVMAVPLYDFTSVMLLRICKGRNPFVGDTQHFSHRLLKHGFTEQQVVLILYLATLCTGLGATFLYQVNLAGAVLIFLQTFMILGIIAIFESSVRDGNASD